ncbi:hypothetical protein JHD48_03520 [Sulfurimonas sp. SAG-AH-194-I05]|nr:hypothetical protein [Sulfurimonas sp. SAG-AH-194-I05]MDF1874804.1 hypothetical protein [Sulfurimonas sp. SAG-AH-194-I05]
MKILTKIIQILFLLFISLTLDILPWIPSLLVENIVNILILSSYVMSAFLVYKLISFIFHKQTTKSIYKNAFYTFVLLTFVGFIAIMQIGISSAKSVYVAEYTFGGKVFYVYTDVLSFEVSLKDENLPLRSPPIFIHEKYPIHLEEFKNSIYAVGKNINKKIYDLK